MAAGAITKKSGKTVEQKEAQKAKGLVTFEFGQDHGKREKGEKVEMHKSTALALEAHKIGKIVGKAKVKIVNEQ